MQLEEMNSSSHTGPSMHYLGVFLEDDAALAKTIQSAVAGKLMSQWWDSSPDAGARKRPRSGFAEPLPSLEVLTITDGKCKRLDITGYISF